MPTMCEHVFVCRPGHVKKNKFANVYLRLHSMSVCTSVRVKERIKARYI